MATAEIKVVTLELPKLHEMMIESAKEGVKQYVKEQEEKQTHTKPTVPMAELVKSRRYGSRNTVAKYRDEIMAEDDNQSIVAKHGSRYYFDPVQFDNWFMNRKKIHAEKLKVDPRRRESWRR